MSSLLHQAVAGGELAKVQQLLDDDEDLLDKQDSDLRTPVMIAAMNGEATVGSILAECGANLKLQDVDGNTALHLACLNTKGRLVTSMLLWGGSERDTVNKQGDTPLHSCCRSGARDAAWLILENGGEDTKEVKNNDQKSPLDLARENGYKELVELLETGEAANLGS